MNIKQAPCMAKIVAPGRPANGWIVQVLYATPNEQFLLPDGYLAVPELEEAWVCESLMHSPFRARLSLGGFRDARYASIRDKYLRPMPGETSGEVGAMDRKVLGVAWIHTELFEELCERMNAAQDRYGDFSSSHEAMGVALEEFDELRGAIHANMMEAVRSEALDLAAVLIRLADQVRTNEPMRRRSVK